MEERPWHSSYFPSPKLAPAHNGSYSMATYSATGLAIFDPSFDPPLDNRPKLSSTESISTCGNPPTSCPKCSPPDSSFNRPVTSAAHNTPLDIRDPLGDRAAYPTPRTAHGEPLFFTPSEVYRSPHDVLNSCAATPLYLSPMVNLKTPTSTYDGVFATPETTPAIFYYESTKSTPDIHQTPHKGDHPPTVEGSCFPPPIYRTPFELVSIGAIDYRPTPTSTINMECHSSLHPSSEAPLEQEFHTPDGSPLSPYHTPHNGSPELLLEFQPPAGYRASPTFGHPLNFLSFSSPSSLETPQGTPTKHDNTIQGSAEPSTTPNKAEQSPILEVFQTTRRLRNQRLHTAPLRHSRSSISLTNAGPTTEEGSLRAREVMELSQEFQKARAITEDFVRSSPVTKIPPQNSRLVSGKVLGSPPNKYGMRVMTAGGSFFNPCHARFPSNSTTSTAFFDTEEQHDVGILDKVKPGRKSLSIITAWPARAATPPPLLPPFEEMSNGAARGDDPLITPSITQEESTIRSSSLADSPVLPDQALLRRTQSQCDTLSTVRTSSRFSSSPLKEGLRVQDAPAMVVEHPDLGHQMKISELLAEEHRASGRVHDTQIPRKPTANHGFAESSSTALGLSPSIYLSPMPVAQFSSNSLDLDKVIKPEIERGLSTPSFISGVLQAGLLLEKLERENTASFEEDMEAVHFQVLTAVVGTGTQASSSSSLSHYSTEASLEHSQLHLSSRGSTRTIYVTATDLSSAAQSSPPNAPAPIEPDLHSPPNHPPHLTLPPASTFTVDPLPRPLSITVSDSANFVHDLSKGFKVDQGPHLLKPPPTADTTEPVPTRVEGGPVNVFLSASYSKPQPKLSADLSSLDRKSDTGVEVSKRVAQSVTSPRVYHAVTRSMGQSSENHLSRPQCTSTLHPLSVSGSTSVSPVSPSSVISRASARLVNPFSFLHPSPLSSTSSTSPYTSPARSHRLSKTAEQPRSHSGTLTPGDMKRPSSARRRLSRLLGGVDFGVRKASSPTAPADKVDAEVIGPDVFGVGEGSDSWIRDSRESATNHRGPPPLDTNADREAATAVHEGKSKKRRVSVRPTSMIWLGSNKETSPVAARDRKKPTKVPLELRLSSQPPSSSDSNSWSMLDDSVSSAVGNNGGLRIINLPPQPAVGTTIDVRKSRSRRKSVAISSGGEGSETEVGQMKGRSRSSFLGAFIRK